MVEPFFSMACLSPAFSVAHWWPPPPPPTPAVCIWPSYSQHPLSLSLPPNLFLPSFINNESNTTSRCTKGLFHSRKSVSITHPAPFFHTVCTRVVWFCPKLWWDFPNLTSNWTAKSLSIVEHSGSPNMPNLPHLRVFISATELSIVLIDVPSYIAFWTMI